MKRDRFAGYRNWNTDEFDISQELLTNVFIPTPLHDGAMIIQGSKIALLQVIYHYQIVLKYQKFRTRHRAAVGISEVSDAFTVVVSEETGYISTLMEN